MIAGKSARGADLLARLGLVALLSPAATPLRAQVSTRTRVSDLAVNAAIGGVLAAARSVLDGRGVTRPLLLGAVGGTMQGVGRQIAASRFTASGLVGREVSALGISLTYSAGVDSLIFIVPVGPITLEVRPDAADRVRARVSLVDVVTIVSTLSDGHSRLDLASSLSAGAPVFTRPRATMPLGYDEAGFTQVGTIFLAGEHPPELRRDLLRHENVHLLQWDAYNQLLTIPMERAILRRLPGGPSMQRFIDIGVLGPTSVYLLAQRIPYERHPWEREAYLLTTGRPTLRPD